MGTVTVPPGGRAGSLGRWLRRLVPDGPWVVAFLGLYAFGFVILIAYPVAAAFGASLTDWPLFGEPTPSGIANYQKLIESDGFHQALINTIVYVVLLVPFEIAIAIGLTVLVNRNLPGRTFFRAVYFAPFVMSLASIGLIWTWLYSPDFGLVNGVLKLIGLQQVRWLADPDLALPALVITSVWRNAGYYMVIFLAGLQGIPEELYEAATIDGAGAAGRFRHITWPLLTPTTFFAVILGVILGFQVFDLSYVMTQGGPAGHTVTLVFLIYKTAFQTGALGYASAIAFVLIAIVLALTIAYFRLERRWVHYGVE